MGPVKLPFAESDLTPLTKRYSSSTIVTMLREIAKCKTAKLDWAGLCKGTATGITNPREYQAVWRSVAYHADLDDSFDGHESPLEDDSDIDLDLAPVPSVSPAVAESLSSFVKADLHQHELEEARLEQNALQTAQTGDIPAARAQQGSGLFLGKSGASAALAGPSTNARGMPYLASATQCAATHGEQPAAAAAAAALACSTSKAAYSGAAMNQSDRKRRRLWTPEEDLALIAAVDKCGEGNWTTVLKNHYDFDRSASQLSQRWALIRKRREVQEKAGYGGSGVSLLATGYKDVRPEGLKSGPLPGSGSQVGTLKDVGNKNTSSGNVPMPIKQPLSSTPPIPVSKRLPVASTPMATDTTTPASVLETQRVRALPTSGVSSSWAGAPAQRPQAHNHAPLRAAGASQAHKGAAPESHVRRPAQGPSVGSQMFYTTTQSATPTVPIDSKYAASRNMGAGVARGASKGVHGPDPMIQAAAMAAGARIAPASAAASLLKAAQSGNVVHIGSGGLPRSKLGLTNQAGSGNAGGSPGIVHYIRTGSGGASLATTSSGLQRTSSHHMQKAQSNQSNRGSGNSSPLSAPTVPPQASRNNSQAPLQSSKQVSVSKRGSSPQRKTSPPTPALASTPASTPPAATPVTTPPPTSALSPLSTPAGSLPQTSVPIPAGTLPQTSLATPAQSSISSSGPSSVPTPSPSSVPIPASSSISTHNSSSISSPAPPSIATPAPPSIATPAPPSIAGPAPPSISTPASSSISTPTPSSVPSSVAAPPPTSVARPVTSATIIASSIASSIATSIASSAPKSTPGGPSTSAAKPSPTAPPSTSGPKSTAAAPPSTSAPKVIPAAPKVTSAAPPSTSAPKVTSAAPPSTSAPKVSPAAPASTSGAILGARPAVSSVATTPASKSKPAPTTPICGFNTTEPVAEEVATP